MVTLPFEFLLIEHIHLHMICYKKDMMELVPKFHFGESINFIYHNLTPLRVNDG